MERASLLKPNFRMRSENALTDLDSARHHNLQRSLNLIVVIHMINVVDWVEDGRHECMV